jgi:hypothetical protein
MRTNLRAKFPDHQEKFSEFCDFGPLCAPKFPKGHAHAASGNLANCGLARFQIVLLPARAFSLVACELALVSLNLLY